MGPLTFAILLDVELKAVNIFFLLTTIKEEKKAEMNGKVICQQEEELVFHIHFANQMEKITFLTHAWTVWPHLGKKAR